MESPEKLDTHIWERGATFNTPHGKKKKIIKLETAKRKHKEIHQDIDIAKDLLKRIPISRNDNRNWKAELPKILKFLHSKEKI